MTEYKEVRGLRGMSQPEGKYVNGRARTQADGFWLGDESRSSLKKNSKKRLIKKKTQITEIISQWKKRLKTKKRTDLIRKKGDNSIEKSKRLPWGGTFNSMCGVSSDTPLD